MSANVFRIGNAVKTNEIFRIYSRVFLFCLQGGGRGLAKELVGFVGPLCFLEPGGVRGALMGLWSLWKLWCL